MTNQELNDLKNRFVANGAATSTTQFAERAENAELWDADGNRYLDLLGGIAVNALGHGHPAWVEAIATQADQFVGSPRSAVTLFVEEARRHRAQTK